MLNLRQYRTIYTGSVKNLRQKKRPTKHHPGVLLFEFTDDYSIFDYGKMPDRIPGKGAATAVSTAYFFECVASAAAWRELAGSGIWRVVKDRALRDELLGSPVLKKLMKTGMPTHYRGIVNHEGKTVKLDKLREPSNVLEVDSVNIQRPEPMTFAGTRIWNYNAFTPGQTNFLVPLECVFRFGMPVGSSLLERLQQIPNYHQQLGLATPPRGGEMFARPVVELFSKLEPADRHLPNEWALNVSGLTNDEFLTIHHYTLLLSLFLRREFEKAKVTLWDGKFEFVHMGQIALGDAITPDELRLTMRGVQLSKEPIRQYYRKHEPKFVAAMKEAKKIAATVDRELADLVNNELKSPPPPMDKEFLAAVVEMYTGLTEAVCGTGLFGPVPSLSRVMKVFARFGIS